jgi:HEXXH motif-containing protein
MGADWDTYDPFIVRPQDQPDSLPPEAFTALPIEGIARQVNAQYRFLVLKSILSYLNTVQRTLKLDLSRIISFYSRINPSRHFSPAIYTAHAQLRDAVRKGDLTPVMDALNQLANLSETTIYDSLFRMTSILNEEWERSFVEQLREEPVVNAKGEPPMVRPLINTDILDLTSAYDKAIALIREVDPVIASDIGEYVTRIKLFAGKALVGATSPRVFGAVFLRLPDPDDDPEVYFCEHIVHEVSHLHLNALMPHDPLINNDCDKRYPAPIRLDPRPMFGIFHATFVLSRMVRVFKRITKLNERQRFQRALSHFEEQFSKGYETVTKEAVLTELGQHFAESMLKCAS